LRVPADITIIGTSRRAAIPATSLGSVAAGHPEQIGAGVYRLARHGGYVHYAGALAQGHLGAQCDGLVLEPEPSSSAVTLRSAPDSRTTRTAASVAANASRASQR
jgi:hypothetical protein